MSYNGYTNYETWVVNLWLDNSECSHDHWIGVAREIYENSALEPTLGGLGSNKMQDAAYILAEKLKNEHEETKDEILENSKLTSSLWADMLGAALSEVNWREIAEHFLEYVEVEA